MIVKKNVNLILFILISMLEYFLDILRSGCWKTKMLNGYQSPPPLSYFAVVSKCLLSCGQVDIKHDSSIHPSEGPRFPWGLVMMDSGPRRGCVWMGKSPPMVSCHPSWSQNLSDFLGRTLWSCRARRLDSRAPHCGGCQQMWVAPSAPLLSLEMLPETHLVRSGVSFH